MSKKIYTHPHGDRQAEITLYEEQRLWVVEIIQNQEKHVHGFYPSLPSAQLILSALGFELI